MRKITTIVMALCLAVVIAGCGATQAEPDEPNALLPTIMYEGKLYHLTDQEIPVEIDPSEIVTADSTVPLSQLPTENGQANFDATYAVTDSGLAVLWGSEWVLFVADDQ
ncbi:MAG: hypothetical protein IJL71_06745 [Oscillospiraceae bacterium]|nr:hypothetical protein [Oscillospiraceae bacterium]